MCKPKSPYKLAEAIEAEAILRRNPKANRSKVARSLGIARVTVVRIARQLESGIRVPVARCTKCGMRILRMSCLRCELLNNGS